jgi:SPOR domain
MIRNGTFAMTMALPQTRPRPTGGFAKLYAGLWALLAAIALAYMVTLAIQPNLLGDFVPRGSEPESNLGQRAAARFATDIVGLRDSIGDIRRDVTTLRSVVSAGEARGRDLAERIAAVEERTKPAVVAEASAPAAIVPAPKSVAQRQAELRAQRAAEKTAAAAAQAAKTAAITEAAQAAPAPVNVTVLNAPAAAPANPIATGSLQLPPAQGVPAPPPPAATAPVVAATVAAFGPGAVKAATPPAGPVGVELASGPSLEVLRLNWSLLADRHGASLKSLEPRYTTAGDGQPYQLVAGPINTPEEAARVCSQLRAKKVNCRVTGFGGNAL